MNIPYTAFPQIISKTIDTGIIFEDENMMSIDSYNHSSHGNNSYYKEVTNVVVFPKKNYYIFYEFYQEVSNKDLQNLFNAINQSIILFQEKRGKKFDYSFIISHILPKIKVCELHFYITIYFHPIKNDRKSLSDLQIILEAITKEKSYQKHDSFHSFLQKDTDTITNHYFSDIACTDIHDFISKYSLKDLVEFFKQITDFIAEEQKPRFFSKNFIPLWSIECCSSQNISGLPFFSLYTSGRYG